MRRRYFNPYADTFDDSHTNSYSQIGINELRVDSER
jgi:hypothetical protein